MNGWIVIAVLSWVGATTLAMLVKRPPVESIYVIPMRKSLRVGLKALSVVGTIICVAVALSVVFHVASLWPPRVELLWPPSDDVAYIVFGTVAVCAWFAFVFLVFCQVSGLSATREGLYFYGIFQPWDRVDGFVDDGRRLWVQGRVSRGLSLWGDKADLSRIWHAIPPDAEERLTRIKTDLTSAEAEL